MQLGFVGTGTMGAPMVGCLLDAGHQLTVYDVRAEATAALLPRGARLADNPATVARKSEVVFTSLPGPAEMEHAADMLEKIRSKLGITIIGVEHIMGVLMRIVDRVIVLDHGEKIYEGAPEEAANDARVTEVYLGKGHGRQASGRC